MLKIKNLDTNTEIKNMLVTAGKIGTEEFSLDVLIRYSECMHYFNTTELDADEKEIVFKTSLKGFNFDYEDERNIYIEKHFNCVFNGYIDGNPELGKNTWSPQDYEVVFIDYSNLYYAKIIIKYKDTYACFFFYKENK